MKGWELMLEGRNDGEDRNTAHGIIIAALTWCFMSSECIILYFILVLRWRVERYISVCAYQR